MSRWSAFLVVGKAQQFLSQPDWPLVCFQGLILENLLDAETLSPAPGSPECGLVTTTVEEAWREEEKKVSGAAE